MKAIKAPRPLRFLDRWLERTAEGASDPWFARISNFRLKLRRLDSRFSWSEHGWRFEDDGRPVYFVARNRGAKHYISGLTYRTAQLAQEYCIDQIEFKDGDLILDCGANTGDLYLYFKRRGLQVDYVGFEPSPREHACLERNAEAQTALPFALWFEDCVKKFYLKSDDADSSLIEIAAPETVIEVRCRRLDHLLEETGIARDRTIKLLKVEAEGAEPEVLRGVGDWLDRIEYIAVDTGPERGLAKEETTADVVNLLVRRGFDLVKVNHHRKSVLFRRADRAAAGHGASLAEAEG